MKKDIDKTKIVFCGGHHTSSLPLIDVLLEHPEYEVIFIGRKKAFSDDRNDSLEFMDITRSNIKFYNLKYPHQDLFVTIPQAITYFEEADESEDPVSLRNETWEEVKKGLQKVVNEYLK